MPMYTYRCENCENQFDQHQSFSEEPLVQCPECNKLALQKVYKPIRVVFKGSGYYVTDNKAKSSTSRNGKTDSSENGKTETKPSKDGEESKPKKAEKPVAETKVKEKSELKK